MESIKGNRIRQYVKELQQTERYSSDDLQQMREEKLRKLLLHALDHVPFYKEFGSLRELIEKDPAAALVQFPVLTKDVVRNDLDRLVAQGVDTTHLILNRTGGSTGQPVVFYMDRPTVEHFEAARWRALSWWGIHIGDPCVMIWGSPIELSQQQLRTQRLKDRFLKNQVFIPSFDLRKEKLDEYLDLIDSYKPVYVYGWASALVLFAEFMLEKGRKVKVPLKAVLNTAETLTEHDRKVIEAAFGCPVINEYGARDGGIIAYECPAGGMHVMSENVWVEVIDMKTKKPVPFGQKGLVVVTDLNNLSSPRLRYQLGDVISLSSEHCSCGRPMPILKSLDGRENDTLVTLDGAYVNGQYFTNVARTLPSVRQFQVIQDSRDAMTLKLLKHDGLTQEDIDIFCQNIRDRMGDIHIDVQLVSEIARQNSGKLRTAMRTFALPTEEEIEPASLIR